MERMSPGEPNSLTERLTAIRAAFLTLALAQMLVFDRPWPAPAVAVYLSSYLAAALAVLAIELRARTGSVRIPVAVDVAATAGFLLFAPTTASFWFLYLFVVFAAASEWGLGPGLGLAGLFTLGVLARSGMLAQTLESGALSGLGLALGMYGAGTVLALLAARDRREAEERRLLARLSGLLQMERGLGESLAGLLAALREAFRVDLVVLALLNDELERVFVWKSRSGDSGPLSPEEIPLVQADAYLLNDLETNLAWNGLPSAGKGFGWIRGGGAPGHELPRMPGGVERALGLRALAAVVVELDGRPVGRLLIANPKGKFARDDLARLARLAAGISFPLASFYQLRRLRAQAIARERGRISRDLHDGVLQTLLGLDIRLGLLGERGPEEPGEVASELRELQRAVRNEAADLRRMVTGLRPERAAVDLAEMMRDFAERFRGESGLAIDLDLGAVDHPLNDQVYRELHHIYREALYNVKKHARASRVVVKLSQDERKLLLSVQDDGRGFDFNGRLTGEELERSGLAPVSILERVRSVGGGLAVESRPGVGSRLEIEILND
jgi:signal transduction histidine kinase